MEGVCSQLLNDLVLLDPPSFIYAARPPVCMLKPGRTGRQRAGQLAGTVGVQDEDDEQMTVYGSYAAVTLCDCR